MICKTKQASTVGPTEFDLIRLVCMIMTQDYLTYLFFSFVNFQKRDQIAEKGPKRDQKGTNFDQKSLKGTFPF